jgi:hypothetical protein
MTARLASESLEAGQSRLEKILLLIESCKYSIHDLSRAVSKRKGEAFRMNMPFELGLDMGRRRGPDNQKADKKFVVFELMPYELKRCLSDLNGTDVQFHRNDIQQVLKKVRDFLRVEAGRVLPGPSELDGQYYTFLGWMTEKKIAEGHTEDEAKDLPTQERLDEMVEWNALNRPAIYRSIP